MYWASENGLVKVHISLYITVYLWYNYTWGHEVDVLFLIPCKLHFNIKNII